MSRESNNTALTIGVIIFSIILVGGVFYLNNKISSEIETMTAAPAVSHSPIIPKTSKNISNPKLDSHSNTPLSNQEITDVKPVVQEKSRRTTLDVEVTREAPMKDVILIQ